MPTTERSGIENLDAFATLLVPVLCDFLDLLERSNLGEIDLSLGVLGLGQVFLLALFNGQTLVDPELVVVQDVDAGVAEDAQSPCDAGSAEDAQLGAVVDYDVVVAADS